jgi:DNA-binding transcriptional LysR family regulator
MDKFANMQAFQSVAESGSFADSARKLNLANSVVSKRIKDLEAALGTQLLMRTTRSVTLTDAGRAYLSHVQKIFEDLNDIESSLRSDAKEPSGTIKLTAPLSFGMQYLAPALASYLEQYPKVSIRTYLSDRRVDLSGEGFDLAIRVGAMKDAALRARKLSAGRRVVCASPAYLKKHGRPKKPSDLQDHNCLSYLNLAEGKSWPFISGGKKIWQPVTGNFLSDNGDLLHQAALAGGGITLLPTFIVGRSIAEKKLAVVLEEYEEKDFDIYAVYPETKHVPQKIRTLIDHFADCFRLGFIQ